VRQTDGWTDVKRHNIYRVWREKLTTKLIT